MRSAILAILILLRVAPLGAQETRANIHGIVSDSLGQQLAGVTVLVDGSDFGIQTDATGEFRVRDLTRGVYLLSVHLSGFVPRTFRVRIPDGYQGEYAVGQIMLQPVGEGFVTLTGTVRDSATMEPVPGVTVGLNERVATFAGQDGTFRIDNVRLGTAYLEARRIGYRPLAVYLDIIEGETFHIDISVSPLPFRLEDIDVTVDEDFETFGPLQHLMRRRKVGQGYSFLRWEIDEQRPLYVTDLFRMLPGVQVRYDQLGERHVIIRGCGSPTVYINGIQLEASGQLEFMVAPDNIEALEVHLGAYTPAEYRNYAGCGVIAVWTR
jgi:hypothetical protein